MYLASICDLLDRGRIVSVDVAPQTPLPTHPRIEFVTSSSTEPAIVERLRAEAGECQTVMVLLDSDHSYEHVRDELVSYHGMVTPGSYLVVEDSNVNGHPVLDDFGPGPMEAIDEFLPEHPEFEIDARCERFMLTFNPRGFLRRNPSA
jgi:cephalosporin hydroxylase